jgi:hypothetical protein
MGPTVASSRRAFLAAHATELAPALMYVFSARFAAIATRALAALDIRCTINVQTSPKR